MNFGKIHAFHIEKKGSWKSNVKRVHQKMNVLGCRIREWEEERLRSRGLRITLTGRSPFARGEMDSSRKPMNYQCSVKLRLRSLSSQAVGASMSMPTASNFHYPFQH